MLFDSSLRKDLARNFVATVVVMVTIVMTILLIRTLGQASRGVVNPSEVLLIMGFTLTSQLTTVLTLSLFITVVATLSRMYSDSEMVIWLSSGRALSAFVPVILRFAWPVVMAIALLALLAWPWSNQQIEDLKTRYEKRNDVERVAPGRFQEASGGRRVFFIDKDSPDQTTGTNVFIFSRDPDMQSTTTAQQGQVQRRGDDRYLVLKQGEQWLSHPQTGELRWTRFAYYDVLVGDALPGAAEKAQSRQVDTLTLLAQPNRIYLGELSWRLGLGLSAINLMLLALPLSAANPRRGRSYQYLLALLVFVVYYNLINLGQSWIAQGRIDWMAWMLVLHAGVFALAWIWLWAQQRQWTWRDLLPRPMSRSAA